MQTEFQNGGVRYSLLVTGRSLREVEAISENLGPDKSLWTQEQRRKHGLANKAPERKMGYLDDEAEIRKRQCRNGRERSAHYYRKPSPVEFTDQPEFR